MFSDETLKISKKDAPHKTPCDAIKGIKKACTPYPLAIAVGKNRETL